MAELFDRHQRSLGGGRSRPRNARILVALPRGSQAARSTARRLGTRDRPRSIPRLARPFDLPRHPESHRVGSEQSPWGPELQISYPAADPASLIAAAEVAAPVWAAASVQERVGVCLEILTRLNRMSFLMGHAVMHTTGQAFAMAFQAGGPHAQDRGLEAVAMAWAEMTRVPEAAIWEKPQGKAPPLVIEKHWRVIPRGISLVIGCNTFPTWNSYPGLFASLATGNAVIVKPHPAAILPLALTVRVARDVLTEAGFAPDAVLLAADAPGAEITKDSRSGPSGPDHRLHRLERFRRLAAQPCRAGRADLHRGGGGELDRHRGNGRLRRHVRQHRLLALALFRTDVHRAAGHLRSARRDRHRSRPQGLRRGRERHSAGGRFAAGRPRAGLGHLWSARQSRDCQNGWPKHEGWAA